MLGRTRTGRRALRVGPAVLAAMLLLGCPKNRSAYADCRNLEKYESSFGVLNGPQFALGGIIDLNTQTLKGAQVRAISLAATDIKQTDPIDGSSILSNADFKVTADADVPLAVTAGLEAYLNNNTLFSLKNYRRRYIVDPAAAISRDAAANSDILSRLHAPAGHLYLVVSSLILADSLQFTLRDKSGVDTKAKVFKSGDYSLSIAYSCEASLAQSAHQGPLLFKGLQLELAPDGTVRAVAPTVDLKNYDLNLGIMAR